MSSCFAQWPVSGPSRSCHLPSPARWTAILQTWVKIHPSFLKLRFVTDFITATRKVNGGKQVLLLCSLLVFGTRDGRDAGKFEAACEV